MNYPFSVQSQDIDRLSPEDCVDLFGKLLYSEARRLGVSKSCIHFTSKTMPDGGIDCSVDHIPADGDVLCGNHFYQIKAGGRFSPSSKNDIEKELLTTKNGKPVIKPEIRRCFEEGGTYVLACMKKQLDSQKTDRAKKHILQVLESQSVRSPKIKVWGQDLILDTASSFPGICAHFCNHGDVMDHDQWSHDPDMRQSIVADEKQAHLIEEIRAKIDSNERRIDVCGDSGAGKTRAVLEATRREDLAPLVVYCETPDCFSNRLRSDIVHRSLTCILVIDYCDPSSRRKIWRKIEPVTSVKLITISTQCDESAGQITARALDAKTIQKIVENYGIDSIRAGRMSDLCGGAPMLAHIVGSVLKSKQNLLPNPGIDQVFDEYISRGKPSSERLEQRRRILFTISLFQGFGNGPERLEEALCAICKIVKKIDGAITRGIFNEHIEELRRLRMLRGKHSLRLGPRILHAWMWAQWYKYYASPFDIKMLDGMPVYLKDEFIGMFEYARGSADAVRVLADLFGGGPFSEPQHLTEYPGPALFCYWARADPAAALRHLEDAFASGDLATRSDDTAKLDIFYLEDAFASGDLATVAHQPQDLDRAALRELELGPVISSLEEIAFEADLFVRATRLLLRLAESYPRGEAANLIIHLFSPSIGPIAYTRAPPETRLPTLKDLLNSEKPERRSLGLRACEAALSIPRNRLAPANDFRDNGWMPKTYGELEDAYRGVIDSMLERVGEFSDKEQQERASIIMQSSDGITRELPGLSGYVAETLLRIKDLAGKEEMVRLVTTITEIRGERIPADAMRKFRQIQRDLDGTSYSDRLKRFAGMDIGVDQSRKNFRDERMRELEALAGESDADKLRPDLEWLVTRQAKCGHMFGNALAQRDGGFSLLPEILEAQGKAGADATGQFLGGYLSVVRSKDRGAWRRIMDRVAKDAKIVRLAGELYCGSGQIDDDDGLRLLDLARSGKIRTDNLVSFVWGSRSRNLSDSVVLQWIECVSGAGGPGMVAGALQMFYFHFVHGCAKLERPELAVSLLQHALADGNGDAPYDPVLWNLWAETAIKLGDHPEHQASFASWILDMMDTCMRVCRPDVVRVLNDMGSVRPDDLWDLVVERMAVPFDDKSSTISAWLSAREPRADFPDNVGFEKISRWIERCPDKLAPLVAKWVKPVISPTSTARQILARYGSDPRVRDALSDKFWPSTFTSHESRRLEEIKKPLADHKGRDDNENVAQWVDHMIAALDDQIGRAKAKEQAHDDA